MPRKKLSYSDMITQPYYKSIINLTRKFQGRYFPEKEGDGLQQLHYRYALQESADIPAHYKKKMRNFFNGDLEELYENGRIIKGCIKKGTHLSFFLKKLVEYDFLTPIIGEDGKKRYETKNLWFYNPPPNLVANEIKKKWKDSISLFEDEYNVGNWDDRGVMIKPVFFGIPDKVFIKLDNNKKLELSKEIDKLYRSIMDFYSYVRLEVKEDLLDDSRKNKMGLWCNINLQSDKEIEEYK